MNAYADLEKELGYYPPTSAAVASKYVPSPVASTPPSVVGRARHSSTTVVLAAALGVAVGVLAAPSRTKAAATATWHNRPRGPACELGAEAAKLSWAFSKTKEGKRTASLR